MGGKKRRAVGRIKVFENTFNDGVTGGRKKITRQCVKRATADEMFRSSHETFRERRKPVPVRLTIVVSKSKKLSRRASRAFVARGRWSRVMLSQELHRNPRAK